MADVKICDRCGKRLDEDRMTFSLNPEPKRFVLSAILFKISRHSWSCLPDMVTTNHDLCIDCVTKLAEWMENKE